MYEEQHLVRSDLNGYKAPGIVLAVPSDHLVGAEQAYPSIIIFMKESDQLPCFQLQLIVHRRLEIELNAMNVGRTRRTTSHC